MNIHRIDAGWYETEDGRFSITKDTGYIGALGDWDVFEGEPGVSRFGGRRFTGQRFQYLAAAKAWVREQYT